MQSKNERRKDSTELAAEECPTWKEKNSKKSVFTDVTLNQMVKDKKRSKQWENREIEVLAPRISLKLWTKSKREPCKIVLL